MFERELDELFGELNVKYMLGIVPKAEGWSKDGKDCKAADVIKMLNDQMNQVNKKLAAALQGNDIAKLSEERNLLDESLTNLRLKNYLATLEKGLVESRQKNGLSVEKKVIMPLLLELLSKQLSEQIKETNSRIKISDNPDNRKQLKAKLEALQKLAVKAYEDMPGFELRMAQEDLNEMYPHIARGLPTLPSDATLVTDLKLIEKIKELNRSCFLELSGPTKYLSAKVVLEKIEKSIKKLTDAMVNYPSLEENATGKIKELQALKKAIYQQFPQLKKPQQPANEQPLPEVRPTGRRM